MLNCCACSCTCEVLLLLPRQLHVLKASELSLCLAYLRLAMSAEKAPEEVVPELWFRMYASTFISRDGAHNTLQQVERVGGWATLSWVKFRSPQPPAVGPGALAEAWTPAASASAQLLSIPSSQPPALGLPDALPDADHPGALAEVSTQAASSPTHTFWRKKYPEFYKGHLGGEWYLKNLEWNSLVVSETWEARVNPIRTARASDGSCVASVESTAACAAQPQPAVAPAGISREPPTGTEEPVQDQQESPAQKRQRVSD